MAAPHRLAFWGTAGTPLTLLAAQFWLATMAAWALRRGPWFSRRRSAAAAAG